MCATTQGNCQAGRQLREKNDFECQVNELNKVAQGLNDAFCESNPTRAQQLRGNWQVIVKGMKRPVPKELNELVEPALLWLADIDRENAEQAAHHQTVQALERVLASSRSLPEIERALPRGHAQRLCTRASNRTSLFVVTSELQTGG